MSVWHLAGSLPLSSVARAIWEHTETQWFLTDHNATLQCSRMLPICPPVHTGCVPTRLPTS
ncbi:hypothetical protein CCMA1212_008787 [Trichoderma ghanense]|uniref:Uncharacterized protein n=1 Tax=Trichoderma ghanense TaxID=65468 RepID=A0ABY2GVX9_9HYPO